MDRRGKIFIPFKNSRLRERTGAFVLIKSKNKLLLIWPDYSPDVLDLPGGGVDNGETLRQAVIRETMEEAGFDISKFDLNGEYSHMSKFYAEDKDEYWDYKQHYFYINVPENMIFQGKKTSPESGLMEWINFSDINSYMVNKTHMRAIEYFL